MRKKERSVILDVTFDFPIEMDRMVWFSVEPPSWGPTDLDLARLPRVWMVLEMRVRVREVKGSYVPKRAELSTRTRRSKIKELRDRKSTRLNSSH